MGSPVAGFGGVEVAPQPVQLGLLVVGIARRRAAGQRLAGPLRLGQRLVPAAVELQDLRAVDQALAPVRHEVRLGVAPAGHRLGPLPGPAGVEGLAALDQHGAVHDPGDRDRHLVGDDGHHGLVEVRGTAGEVVPGEEHLAAAQPAQRHHVGVGAPLADGARLLEGRLRSVEVAAP